MDRYTRKDAEAAFARLVKLVGGRTGQWNDVGTLHLDCNPTYGGYIVNQCSSTSGAMNDQVFVGRRLSAREFCTAVRAAEDAFRLRKSIREAR